MVRKDPDASGPMAIMVSHETRELISILADLIKEEQRRERRVSDNEAIRLAMIEAIEAAGRRTLADNTTLPSGEFPRN